MIQLPPCIFLKEEISDLMKGFLSLTSCLFIHSDVCKNAIMGGDYTKSF